MTDERTARMCLAAVVEPGHRAVGEAVAEFGAEAVWAGLAAAGGSSPLERRAQTIVPEDLVAHTRVAGQRFVIPGDEEWPAGMSGLAECEPVQQLGGGPLGLWVSGAGRLGELTAKAVAIVGSRASTAYGDRVAADFAAELSEAGRTVVSGGAYGIDAAAHRGALAGRTPTVAVQAGGLDQPYPSGHAKLFSRIAEAGVVVGELAPGEHPTRVRFLARNRLIAAMSEGTVMVEAAARSGARNTVTWANALRRLVMAVPGQVTSANSVTPHRLIREAEATLVSSPAEVLELLSPLGGDFRQPRGEHRPTDDLAADELRLFEAIPARGALSAGELALKAGLAMPTCLALLSRLAEQGFISQDAESNWRLPARLRKDRRASE
ncbi:MAG: DNA-processing protein DprA [Propionicimonas sp.]|uniref:DNA-processing protein DprA n=1 Tax=Propionicimonas sp. TaxID=1955623 RepID=UPI001D9E96E5|nr:DNA-processing protein DprA [Propionicimonas sp.]MBU4187997.1 DNA-processing protein DprA [Actinomycetota bacterium]MBU4207723.1 DNA-processing protein DprA [Actinomycetota bacterium]MBU4249471.1 DNA-processing protein DprA [Actinomycetota bacterium]MBU4362894.1 DNA-processing protein DprA [Actinomycetota bacterium]MBU4409375.1 DNA-processing protein DprA [Actinomycetota bacterium]